VEIETGRTIVSVVGEGLRGTPGIAARVFSTISDINVSMISVGASSVNLTFMVDDARAQETIVRLHRAYFEDEGSNQPTEALMMEVRA
jgi:aspartate kinase